MVVVGGFVFLIALTFLDYIERFTIWDLTTRVPVILTVVAVLTVALTAASTRTDAVIVPVLALGFSFFLLGRTLPIGALNYSFFGSGLWLASAATIAMSVGGVLALTGRASFANRFAKPS